MAVLIENEQEKLFVTAEMEALTENVVTMSLETENFRIPSEVSIIFVDNERIREINKHHRNIDKPTDVLSFPMLEFENGKITDTTGDIDRESNLLLLGDIVISLEKAKEQSLEYGHSFEREVAFLISHGAFHLLGYDHMDEESERLMLAKQELILTKLGFFR